MSFVILGLRTYRVHRADREPLLNFMLESLRLAQRCVSGAILGSNIL
jgi:hypothetical protein